MNEETRLFRQQCVERQACIARIISAGDEFGLAPALFDHLRADAARFADDVRQIDAGELAVFKSEEAPFRCPA